MTETLGERGSIADTVSSLCQRVESLITRRKVSQSNERILIAMAGVPGSGKSTISAALLDALRQRDNADVVVLPMDGFHYSRAVLATFEDPVMALRKRGAPFTFDAHALIKLIALLKNTPVTAPSEPEVLFKAPSFDHADQDPVQEAVCISSRTSVVIVEGNYTLLNMKPWNQILQYLDERWFVNVLPEVALVRLVKRHILAGIETSAQAALIRAKDNDMPNGDLIRARLVEPDVQILN
ncbi:phosphoribulokinase/uridine kinase [Mariannaea sp. PMI_226]|nr:phosphoribulokinase/uridine kinase [Mariannaea sp. PMI_226]